jgi:hypothetical protein
MILQKGNSPSHPSLCEALLCMPSHAAVGGQAEERQMQSYFDSNDHWDTRWIDPCLGQELSSCKAAKEAGCTLAIDRASCLGIVLGVGGQKRSIEEEEEE